MANFFQFKTLLVVFVLFFSANVRANVGDFSTLFTENTELCEAPPPDSFRVTSVSGTFVTLSWLPAWPGALHLVELKRLDGNGNWNSDQIFDNVPGDSLFIGGLISGQSYRVSIATKCSSGEVGTFFSTIDFITLILDLSIAGRTPINPQPMSCLNIPYDNYEWVGFRVSGGGYTGLFEVTINGFGEDPYASIDRVFDTEDKIVAVKGNVFPTINFPVIHDVPFVFKMVKLNQPANQDIGFLKFSPISDNPALFNLCAVKNHQELPWRIGYLFTMLYAHEVIINKPKILTTRLNNEKKEFLVSNPFSENLNINTNYELEFGESVTFRLWTVQGQKIFDVSLEYLDSQISFPLYGLQSGLFILEIETENSSSTHKVIKI